MGSYTDISKPTDDTYTEINKSQTDLNPYGSAIYGTNKYGVINNYTDVSKPTGSVYTAISKPT